MSILEWGTRKGAGSNLRAQSQEALIVHTHHPSQLLTECSSILIVRGSEGADFSVHPLFGPPLGPPVTRQDPIGRQGRPQHLLRGGQSHRFLAVWRVQAGQQTLPPLGSLRKWEIVAVPKGFDAGATVPGRCWQVRVSCDNGPMWTGMALVALVALAPEHLVT